MFRQVVKGIPTGATLVQPSEAMPYYSAPVEELIWDGEKDVKKTVELIHAWEMESTTARLLGEAKALRGRVIKVRNNMDMTAVPCWVAWYGKRIGVGIYQMGADTYLVKEGK
jgi:hypothetical protein